MTTAKNILFSRESGVTCTVDVIIPCYNYGCYLIKCIQSVLEQQGVCVRILIIDDASTDSTEAIGRALAKSDPAIEFRRHTTNKGHIATYNEGIEEWSTSDYIVLLSADDLLAPGSLKRATQVMEIDHNVGMVYGRAIHFAEEWELPKTRPRDLRYFVYEGVKWLEERFRAGCNVIASPEVVVRGSIQRAIGGYRTVLPHSGDLEMWLRIASVSNIGYIQNQPQAFYRVHPASMQRTKFKDQVSDFRQRRAAFNHFLQNTKIPEICTEYLADLAQRALAREALWDVCRTYDRNQVDNEWNEELISFALSTFLDAKNLPEYKALLRRRLLGPFLCHRLQLFIVPATIKWANRKWRRLRWVHWGI